MSALVRMLAAPDTQEAQHASQHTGNGTQLRQAQQGQATGTGPASIGLHRLACIPILIVSV